MLDLAEAMNALYEEVEPHNFYRDIFPIGSFEKKGVLENGKYNGIAVSIKIGEHHAKRYTVTDDLEVLDDLIATDDFCLMSPISYIGKSRASENARFMYALAIDLDGVATLDNWRFLLKQINEGDKMLAFVWGLPKPTYLVSSGSGIHLYYVFDKAVPMFENIVEQLEVLKRRLTWQAWTQGASTLHDNVQYESLFQGFRIVGTITKDGGRCRAFKVGNKVGIEYLNQFVPDDYKVKQFTYQSKLRLDKAKELYPEWYQKRVVEKKPRNTWTCNPALYQWWIRMLKDGAQQGHRYWCIMVLAIYAKKCGIDKDVLEEDSYGLIPFMNSIGNGKDEFTEDDVLHALEAYRDSYMKYSIDKIVYRTGIQIKKNKRNGRKQNLHLKGARAIQEINDPTGEWRKGAGRKPKGDMVAYWRDRHPNGTKIQCERDTGLSRHTVLKWWN